MFFEKDDAINLPIAGATMWKGNEILIREKA